MTQKKLRNSMSTKVNQYEINFIRSIPMTQLIELRNDIVSLNYADKLASHKNEQIKEMEKQIEKMKNMQNCKHNWESKGQCILKNGGYCICDKWELAE